METVEWLNLVNEQDEVIGRVTRDEAWEKRLPVTQELHLHNGRKALPAERIWECLRHRFRGSASAF